MCRERPGPRCSDHPAKKLERNSHWESRTISELKEVNEELSTTITNKRRSALTAKRRKLEDKLVYLTEEKALLQLEYDATPRGRKELEEKLRNEQNEEVKELIAVDLQVGKQRRKWQLAKSKEFHQTEFGSEDGPERVIEKAKKERALAQKKADDFNAKKKIAQEKLNQAKALAPSDKRKQLIRNISKTIYMISAVHSFYQLIMEDMDTYISKRSNNIVKKLAVQGSATLAVHTVGKLVNR
jgi:hypothetical protein